MSEAATVGRSVIKVTATDQDTGTNAEITYEIISGDDQGNSVSRNVLQYVRKIFIDVAQSTRNVLVIYVF